MSHDMRPPEWWTRVLHVVVPREDREHVGRELDALFQLRVERQGPRAARTWYRREVLSFVLAVRSSRRRIVTQPYPRRSGDGAIADLWRDVRRTARALGKSPGFTAVAVVMLTLGIGANAVLFSVVDHVALRALPYHEPDRLVRIWPGVGMLRGELDIMQRESNTLSLVAGYVVTNGFNLETNDGSRRVEGALISSELLDVLRVLPAVGNNFTREQTATGADDVVLLAHGIWREQYGADADVVGRSVVVDGAPKRVMGVLPAGFAFPNGDIDLFLPLVMNASDVGVFWGWGGHRAVARLEPEATPALAREELRALSLEMRSANPLWTPREDFRADSDVVPLRDALVGDIEPTLLILLGAVGLVLLVACANVANLLLARGLSRRREIAVRAALGASRWRIAREHLVESLMIAALGCAVALLAAQWALGGLVALLPPEIPRVEEIALDGRVIGVGISLAMLVGVLAGLLPAIRGSRAELGLVLRESTRGAGSGRGRRRLSATMVVAQIAVSVVLITGAGLLIRSLGALAAVDPGFRTDGVTTARLTLAGDVYDAPVDRYRFFRQVVERMRAVPGVASVSIGTRVPFGVRAGGVATFIDGVTEDPNVLPVLSRVSVMPDYFSTLGIPLVVGRGIEDTDAADAPLVAVVDQTAAERFWPGESPIGRRVRYPWRGAPWIEIVGVVGGVADKDLAVQRVPTYYVPMAQLVQGSASLVVRGSVAEEHIAPAIRRIVREVDERVPVSRLVPFESLLSGSMARARWTTSVLTLFAGMTLLLGAVGVYGIVAYSVRGRTQEIGVRMALGANAASIRASVLRDGLLLIVPGTVLGILLAVPGARLLAGLLFGVSTLDPVVFGVVPLILAVASIVAVYIPSRRATSVDPAEALRAET